MTGQTTTKTSSENINKRQRLKALALAIASLAFLVSGMIFGGLFLSRYLAAQKAERKLYQSHDISLLKPQDESGIVIRPTAISINGLKINAPMVPVALAPDGSLQIPAKGTDVGWFIYGAQPGSSGTAVLTGHLDTTTGPAVFWNLRKIRAGDHIQITRSDGSIADFKVDGIQKYPQDNFPTQQVYGQTNYPALRVITCAGTYSRSLGRYSDNLVVYASLENIVK